jgi:hypothetical protein
MNPGSEAHITNTINRAFEQVTVALNLKLKKQGYSVVHQQAEDQVFNSRFIIWSNNEDALRLTWDGKERWFILEVAYTLPLSALTAWDEIIITPFDPAKDDEHYIVTISAEILDSLS